MKINAFAKSVKCDYVTFSYIDKDSRGIPFGGNSLSISFGNKKEDIEISYILPFGVDVFIERLQDFKNQFDTF